MLVTEGKEQQILKEVLATKDFINQKIGKSNEVKNILYKDCPRLVPPEFNPQCVETFINIASIEEAVSKKTNAKKETKAKESKAKRKSPKQVTFFAFIISCELLSLINVILQNVQKKTNGVKKFFKPIEIDKEIDENFDLSSYRNTEHGETVIDDQSDMMIDPDLSSNLNNSIDKSDMDRQYDDDVSLEEKFEKIYSQYCDIKRRQATWNGFADKLSKTACNTDHVPDVIKKFLVQMKDSTENRVFRTRRKQIDSTEKQLNVLRFMSLMTKRNQLNASKSAANFCDPGNQENDTEVELHCKSLIDTQTSFSMQLDHQSKYASQHKLEAQTERVISMMTPLQQIASSTPHKMCSFKPVSSAPMHSPIVGSPLKNNLKQIHRPNSNCQRDSTDSKWYLKYLGLKTVYDIFSDDSNPEIITNTYNTIQNKSDEQQAKLCDTLNKSVCGNESLIEEESQYTVSRILVCIIFRIIHIYWFFI